MLQPRNMVVIRVQPSRFVLRWMNLGLFWTACCAWEHVLAKGHTTHDTRQHASASASMTLCQLLSIRLASFLAL
ncbi:hypothetical protein V8C37DRAFT_292171 [Trichoderma ceciliae]